MPRGRALTAEQPGPALGATASSDQVEGGEPAKGNEGGTEQKRVGVFVSKYSLGRFRALVGKQNSSHSLELSVLGRKADISSQQSNASVVTCEMHI